MTTPLPDRLDLSVSLPWQTVVGAKRLARQRGLSLADYVGGLIGLDLEVEAEVVRQQAAEDLAQLRADREGGQ